MTPTFSRITAIIITVFVIFPPNKLFAGFNFDRNLKIGMSDQAVYELQKLLNSDPDTEVADYGPGSPGNETFYFGPATLRAVIAFQEKYASEILAPAGLFQGNGFVGAYTLRKLNSIASKNISLAQTNEPGTVNLPVNPDSYRVLPEEQIDIYATDKFLNKIQAEIIAKINNSLSARTQPSINLAEYSLEGTKVFIQGISSQQGYAGTRISISGRGFGTKNSVYFGNSYVLRGVLSQAGEALSFEVPKLPAGKYDVVVKSDSGTSNSVVFVIRDANSPHVSITSITPATASYGQEIVITGTGFAKENNDVFTTYGVFRGLPSTDGTKITFKYSPQNLSGISSFGKTGKSYSIGISVINGNGITGGNKYFTLEI